MTVKTELSALSVLNELEEVSSYLNKENLNWISFNTQLELDNINKTFKF